jgi:membrane protease YdiL (CAAX protease family)
LLQTFLLRLVRRRWIAISLASLAFGAVHLQQPHAIAALAVLGLLIGYAYERTGSLLPPILIHALFNLNTLIGDALAASHPH